MMRTSCMLLFGIVMLAVNSAAALGSVVVGHYDCNEGSGYVIHDSSPFGNNGTLSLDTRWAGSCLDFPGYTPPTLDGVVPHDPSLDFNGYIELSARIVPEDSGKDILPVISKGGSSSTVYALCLYNNQVFFQANNGTGGTLIQVWGGLLDAERVDFGEEAVISAVYDMEYVRLYKNGVLIEQQPASDPIINDTGGLYFGVDYFGWDERYQGLMDDMTVTVPEPATLSLLAVSGLLVTSRRRRPT